ncbi:unnamed protein product [Candidula unifasciata]|uniref:Uncharacterized protein n=1 Tax=Candidula unifasciata TaxID=100452 RepID=A0A8S3ZA35_9EUPU|nr:unnamed protein product [Candidula unifasciata]
MTENELSSPTSTSSSDDFSPRKMDKVNYKKSNKPMMEKKRRARINCCLNQLKSLVLQAMKKDNSQYSKLEKADILELTVRHLKEVQRYQASSFSSIPDAMSKYRDGFNECAGEIVRYLAESQAVNDEARSRILSHLASLLSPINNIPLQQNHVPILPAQLQQAQHHLQQQQHQQQQQSYPQQLHLQQQQTHHVIFASSSQSLATDANNNKSSMPHPAFLAPTGNNVDISHMISGSPTAFQSPIIAGVNGIPNLQFPYVTTAAMTEAAASAATTAHLQLLPTTLPSGHVALVLAPQSMPSMTVFGSRTQNSKETFSQQTVSGSLSGDLKPQVKISDNSLSLGKKRPEALKDDGATFSGSRQLSSMASVHSLSSNKKHTNTLANCSVSNPGGTFSRSSSISNTEDMHGLNVVRTTSTWRPW